MKPFTEFVDTLERAARNGTKAHVPSSVVREIVAHPAWREFMAERLKELVSSWQPSGPPLPESSSVPSGSTGGPSARSGSSHGTMTVLPDEVVESAVRRRALANMAAMENPRRKRKTH